MEKLNSQSLKRLSIDDFKLSSKLPVILVLDNIRSLHNIGSVFRTADGFGIESVFLCGITACPPHREIEKTALGASNSIQWQYFKNTLSAIDFLRNNGFNIIALEQTSKSVLLQNYAFEKLERVALILGNEVDGVDIEVLKQCDDVVEIPQFGTKHSFNVSVSAGIVLWDVFLKNR